MAVDLGYKESFDEYRKSFFQIECDIRFWKWFSGYSVEYYKKQNPSNDFVTMSRFTVRNIFPHGKDFRLWLANDITRVDQDELYTYIDEFFVWVMNLSLIRLYNAVELLLLQGIRLKFYPNMANPMLGKNENTHLTNVIRAFVKSKLGKETTKNNKHIISFLKLNVGEISTFLEQTVIFGEWKVTWEKLFDLISILRHIITHHAMILTQGVRYEINSIAGDLFEAYFANPLKVGEGEVIRLRDEHQFLLFTSHINDFAGNMLRLIAGQTNFEFVGLWSDETNAHRQ